MHQGEGYGICRAVHAEQNALLNCSREQTIGADLYNRLACPNAAWVSGRLFGSALYNCDDDSGQSEQSKRIRNDHQVVKHIR